MSLPAKDTLTSNPNYVNLDIASAQDLILAVWRARRAHHAKVAPLVIGAPGTGKTELGKILARATQRPFVPLEMQGAADEDINGIPTRDPNTGQVVRLPIGPIRAAQAAPAVFMLDEIDRSGSQKQGALLAGLRERRFGDAFLHAETDLLLAANGASSGGTHNLISAFLNRCLPVNFVQNPKEVQDYLAGGWRKAEAPDPISLDVPGWPVDKLNAALADLMVDFAMTANKTPGLIVTDPPDGAEESGAPWASGRAIVEGLKVFNVGLAMGLKGDTLLACLAGCISKEAAGAFFTVRRVRDRLPSPEEIQNNPQGARVPDANDTEANVGVLGLAAIAASKNANNAWLYAARLQNKECGHALCRGLMRFPATSPEALRIKMTMMGRVGIANEA